MGVWLACCRRRCRRRLRRRRRRRSASLKTILSPPTWRSARMRLWQRCERSAHLGAAAR